LLSFWETRVFLHFGDTHEDEQMDTPVAWSRFRCRERRLNKATFSQTAWRLQVAHNRAPYIRFVFAAKWTQLDSWSSFSLAFRLGRLQKFGYGVPPFQKLPVWRSGAFRLSLSTGYCTIICALLQIPFLWQWHKHWIAPVFKPVTVFPHG